MPSEEQVAAWRAELERAQADPTWADATIAWRAARSPAIVTGLLGLLRDYLDGTVALKEFQTTFDKRTRTDWNIMGLKGLSGGMFLNTLVKHVPDQDAVDKQLKAALPLPTSVEDGAVKMAAFVSFVESLSASGVVPRTRVQAARIPFFQSAWW